MDDFTIERLADDSVVISVPGVDRVWHLFAGPSCSYDDPCEHRAELGMSTWSIEGWDGIKHHYNQEGRLA